VLDASGLDTAPADVLRSAAAFRTSRRAMEADALDRLSSGLPLGQLTIEALPTAGLTADDIDRLADTFADGSND
jgi:hypothetical protein